MSLALVPQSRRGTESNTDAHDHVRKDIVAVGGKSYVTEALSFP